MPFKPAESQNSVNLLQYIVRQFHSRRGKTGVQLRRLGRTDDHRTDSRQTKNPRQGQRSHFHTQTIGEPSQSLNLVQVLISKQIIDLMIGTAM